MCVYMWMFSMFEEFLSEVFAHNRSSNKDMSRHHHRRGRLLELSAAFTKTWVRGRSLERPPARGFRASSSCPVAFHNTYADMNRIGELPIITLCLSRICKASGPFGCCNLAALLVG